MMVGAAVETMLPSYTKRKKKSPIVSNYCISKARQVRQGPHET